MTLTQQDLTAIGDLIDQKLEVKLEEKLETKLEEKLEAKLEEKLDQKFDEKLAPIHQELKKIRRDLDTTITSFDRDIISNKKRISRVEHHLNLPPQAS